MPIRSIAIATQWSVFAPMQTWHVMIFQSSNLTHVGYILLAICNQWTEIFAMQLLNNLDIPVTLRNN